MKSGRLGTTAASAVFAGLMVLALTASGCHHTSVDDLLAQGKKDLQATNLGDAEKNFQKAVEIAPKDPRTHLALGNLYIFEQKPDEAKQEFMHVLELDPKSASAHASLANIYSGNKEFGMSENQYRAAIALAPSDASYHAQLGLVLQREGKLKGAEDEYRTAIGLDPKNAQAHLDLANLLNAEGPSRQAEAENEYAQVRALDPALLPAAAPPSSAPAAEAPASAPPAATVKIKPVRKIFRLFHNSPVYEQPDRNSRVVAHVHAHGSVRVTGIAGNWLRIKLRNGTVGFIPISTAE